MTLAVKISRRRATATFTIDAATARAVELLPRADRADLEKGLVDAVEFTLGLVELRRQVEERERRAA